MYRITIDWQKKLVKQSWSEAWIPHTEPQDTEQHGNRYTEGKGQGARSVCERKCKQEAVMTHDHCC